MTDFVTSDLHFFHTNITQASARPISKGFNRPFSNCEEMHETIVADWNARVSPSDRVFILGDLSFSDAESTDAVLGRLNGQKFLVKGNHDSTKTLHKLTSGRLAWVKDYHEQFFETERHGRLRICLFHFPILSWSSQAHGSWHFHGHSHGNLTLPEAMETARIVDVGVDATQRWTGHWGPVSIDEVLDARAPGR